MNEDHIYDVLIIGGGLAGLSLAIQLARSRHKVLVLEKDDYPRHKVCGEYISMESKPFLERIGLAISDMQLPVINELLLTDIKGNKLSCQLPQGGFGISRYKLDAALAQLTRESGATLLTKTKADNVSYTREIFSVTSNGISYKAKVVCGSWGKRSNMDIKWQRDFINAPKRTLNNYVGVKYHIAYNWPDELIALHNFKNGYCGLSHIEENKCCLCYLTTAANLQQSGNDIAKMEQQILMRNPYLKDIFNNATFLYKHALTISQISFAPKEQVYDHVLLLGDSAGLISPLCGNGMSMAFHASLIAYQTINDFLANTINRAEMEATYLRNWKYQFNKRLSTGRFLQSWFGRNNATTFFLKTMKALPFMQQPIIKATTGNPF